MRSDTKPRSPAFALLLPAGLVLLTALLLTLGVWQLERLGWKRDLIARVDARVHAAPVAAPARAAWPSVSRDGDEYRHVVANGRFKNERETFVYASTELGAGYWVMAPLVLTDGTRILINRGFVPPEKRERTTRTEGLPTGDVAVTGLLRMSDPKGTFLRSNVPAEDRWYSRDVSAIAAKRGLENIAPYFIDADDKPNKGGYPVGGLTQISFSNNHLLYAITWFVLALMTAALLVLLLRNERR